MKARKLCKETFYGEKYLESITPEWHDDGVLDFTIDLKAEILLDPKFGFNIKVLPEKEGYIDTDLGTYYYTTGGSKEFFIWLWAIPSHYNSITERTRRTKIGTFHLLDEETCTLIPNTKTWNEFKRGIRPLLNSIMIKEIEKIKKEE